MRSMEFTGRSVDEAVFHGLQEMGVSIDEVEIETLQTETKGIFGIGSKMARVRLTEREPEYVMERQEELAALAAHEPAAPREERQPRRREGGRSRDGRRERRDRDRDREEAPRGPRGRDHPLPEGVLLRTLRE